MSAISSASLSSVMSDSSQSNDDKNKSSSVLVAHNSVNFEFKTKRISQSILFRGMIFFQILAYGSYSVLVHLCEKNGKITFSSATMNLMIEFIKLMFSLNAFLCWQRIPISKISLLQSLKKSIPYSIPAILYFLNNNLAVHMQLHMDPASYQILSNFKILTTAILYRLVIKQSLTRRQWFALTLLFLGGFAYSLGTLKNSSFVSKTLIDSSLVIQEMYIRPLGIPMIMIYCTLSGLAGVYNEWILKRNYSDSIHLQNIFLYSYGTFLNFIPAFSIMITISQTADNYHFNLFHGFSVYTWLIVFTQALNGLFMSVVIKYSSNIIRLFVISFSLVVTTVLSFFIYHTNFNMYFVSSFITMICALSLYYTK